MQVTGTVLLEREHEQQLLSERLGALAGGAGAAVVVEGPMGIGKTALLGWVASAASASGAAVVRARASRLGESLHAGVLRDWFAKRARRSPVGAVPFDGPGSALRECTGSAEELAYAVRWVLDDMTRQAPVLLLVDDVQWADPASVAVITDLLAHVTDLGCLLVVAQRTGGGARRAILEATLAPHVDVLRLGPLSPGGTAALVSGADEGVRDEIVTRSAGNPLFALCLADSSRQAHRSADALAGVVAGQMAGLDPQARSLAQVLAVFCSVSATVDPGLLVRTWGASPAVARRCMERLRRAGLAEGTDEWRLAHPLMTEALLAMLTADEVSEWHLRAARETDLMAQDGTGARETASGHWLRTRPGDSRALRERLARQGREALDAGNAGTASRYLERALAELPGGDDEVDLLLLAAGALARCDRVPDAVAAWERAVGLCASAEQVGDVLAAAGDDLVEIGKISEALDLFRRWAQVLGPSAGAHLDEARAKFVARSRLLGSVVGEELGDLGEMVDRVMRQHGTLDSHADRLVLSAASVAQCLGPVGDAATARRLAVRSWGEGRLLAEETSDSGPLYLVTAALNWSDAFPVALEVLDAAIAEAREHGRMLPLATASYCRAFVRLRAGDVLGALADVEVTQELRRLGWDAYLSPLLACQVMCLRVRGEEVPEAVLADLTSCAERGMPFLDQFALDTLGEIYLDRGRPDLARPFVERALALAAVVTWNPAVLPVRATYARLLLAEGEHEGALEAARQELALAREWGSPRCVAAALVVLVTTERAVRPPAADDHDLVAALVEAIDLTEGHPDVLARAEAQVLLGELWAHRLGGSATTVRAGEVAAVAIALEDVVDHLRSAHRTSAGQGLEPLAVRARDALVRMGAEAPSWRSAASLLSGAERRVVDLAVEGRTNRQIAAELFVTLKTVEWHLSASYRKLQIRSRAQLSAAMRELVPVGDVPVS